LRRGSFSDLNQHLKFDLIFDFIVFAGILFLFLLLFMVEEERECVDEGNVEKERKGEERGGKEREEEAGSGGVTEVAEEAVESGLFLLFLLFKKRKEVERGDGGCREEKGGVEDDFFDIKLQYNKVHYFYNYGVYFGLVVIK